MHLQRINLIPFVPLRIKHHDDGSLFRISASFYNAKENMISLGQSNYVIKF